MEQNTHCFLCGAEQGFEQNMEMDDLCIKCGETRAKSDQAKAWMEALFEEDIPSLREAKRRLMLQQQEQLFSEEQVSALKEELRLVRGTKGWLLMEKYRRMRINHLGIDKVTSSLREEGFRWTMVKIVHKITKKHDQNKAYQRWISVFEPSKKELEHQREEAQRLASRPLVSILVPVFETDRMMLIEMVESVRNQTYDHWELCLADGCSSSPHVKELLSGYAEKDPRINVRFLSGNKGIIGNSNEALQMCTGDYISLLDHDDTLAPFALFEIVKVINGTGAEFIYSDEDKINRSGNKRYAPHFKPDWSPDTLKSYNYITHMTTVKAELMRRVGGFRTGFEGSQDHDLILRACARANRVEHISKILYHWRAHESSAAGRGDAKPYAIEAGKRAIAQSLKDAGILGTARDGITGGTYRAVYEIDSKAKVSIIIPTRNHAEALKKCVESILLRSTYQNYEILLLENGSTEQEVFEYYESLGEKKEVRVIPYQREFNYSAICNYGASKSDGEYLLFLNNDVEVIEKGWMEAMLEHAQRDNVGAVGAKLVFPGGKIQHAGVVVGMKGWADHVCAGMVQRDVDMSYHYKFFVDTIRNVSAVTGACMMISRRNFDTYGGFDENFILCGSDVELCLRYLKNGLQNVFTPYAKLYHHESLTRKEVSIPDSDFQCSFKAYKPYLLSGDPYYNKNFDYRKSTPTILTEKISIQELNPLMGIKNTGRE